jgi:hypothetical protein
MGQPELSSQTKKKFKSAACTTALTHQENERLLSCRESPPIGFRSVAGGNKLGVSSFVMNCDGCREQGGRKMNAEHRNPNGGSGREGAMGILTNAIVTVISLSKAPVLRFIDKTPCIDRKYEKRLKKIFWIGHRKDSENLREFSRIVDRTRRKKS